MPEYTWPVAAIPPIIDTPVYSAVQQARRQMLVAHAEGVFLSALGQNYGVIRPEILTDDEMYRNLVKRLAWLPKTILGAVYGVLEVVLGTQGELIAAGKRPWKVFEFLNEIVVELPFDVLAASNENASYLHGFTSYVIAGSTATSVILAGDARLSAVSLIGLSIQVRNNGVWANKVISVVSYDPVTDRTTLTTGAFGFTPAGGDLANIIVPGDGFSVSYRGDYIAPSGYYAPFIANAGVSTNTITVYGDASIHMNAAHSVTLQSGTETYTRIINTISYSHTTNLSTIVLTATIPGSITGTLFRALEEADDGNNTMPHDDRVYITGEGLYQIVSFYLLTLVKAAGVGLRVEKI